MDDWKGYLGPVGALFRLTWADAARTTQALLAAHTPRELPSPLPKGLTAISGPGAGLDWIAARPLRGALGGRIVELYFRQLFEKSAPVYADFSFGRFRFDATKDLLRWTPATPVPLAATTREALRDIYEGLFAGNDATVAQGVTKLGLSRSESAADSAAAVSALRAHLSGISLRAVDFRQVSLLSTSWRISSAAAKHGTQVPGDALAVAFLLGTMTRTLRQLRATIDVHGAFLRAKDG